ncbi:hypothetical protein LXL04_018213 [Taraxacum kok-saghyz]
MQMAGATNTYMFMQDKPKAVEILVNDLKVFSTFNEDLYKEITQLLTLSNFRDNEQLSKYGDTKIEVNNSLYFRQLWVWIHAAALTEGYNALKSACESQVAFSSCPPCFMESRSRITKIWLAQHEQFVNTQLRNENEKLQANFLNYGVIGEEEKELGEEVEDQICLDDINDVYFIYCIYQTSTLNCVFVLMIVYFLYCEKVNLMFDLF